VVTSYKNSPSLLSFVYFAYWLIPGIVTLIFWWLADFGISAALSNNNRTQNPNIVVGMKVF
jgi:hypothetical protein